MPLQPIAPREPAHQAAEHILRRAILRGELAPGERLPPERELATQLGVSRLTLRSALAMLDAAGLVTVRHGSGYVVRDFVRDGGPDLLAGVAELASERGEFPDIAAELLRVRRHLAHAALERLVEHPPTPAAIHAVVAAIDAMASVGADELALARADLAVLAAVLDATRSPVLRLCLNPVTTVVGGSAALRAAIYVEPASNVAGWRLLAAWMTRPRAEDLERILAVLAARDAATLEHLSRGRRKPRRSSR
ncbi:MAG: FadR family transcriptional regulator [Myxococcales bacterium]|nr:FadR family transcriptional regulator [Myxococcales bacterium]